jgi:ERCC4-type nuclease
MIIKVDNREVEVLAQIKQLILIPVFKNIQVIIENLPIGDFIIADEKEEIIIIERKTINDLLASIKDGRYNEQSYRLNGLTQHNHNIIYLVEGDVNKVNRFKGDNRTEKLTVYSAIFSLNHFKGFSVFRTFSIDETALTICNMAYKLEKSISSGKKSFYPNLNNCMKHTTIDNNKLDKDDNNEGNNKILDEEHIETTEKDYINMVKKVKKENITPENIGEIMLCQIPGISSVTALAIIDKFKTMPELIKQLEINNDCLKDVTYTNSKGQIRKINKNSTLNIVKYLLKK